MNYSEAGEILKLTFQKLVKNGFPKHEIPALFADWTAMCAVGSAGVPGGLAAAARVRRQTEEMAQGEHGELLQKRAGRMFSTGNVAGIVVKDLPERYDFSGIRIAIEHLHSHQALPLDRAAASTVAYLLALVFEHMGPERAAAPVNTATREWQRLATEAGVFEDQESGGRVS